jgi:hypothetical protein
MKKQSYSRRVHSTEPCPSAAAAVPDVNVMKLFSSSLTKRQNKLDRFFLASLINLVQYF